MVSKKQKEKRKDFQKQKLKVGKGKLQPNNATSVDFKAKAIHLKQQSIIADLTAEAELDKYLSLCKHHSNTVRKEALLYVQQHLHDVKSMKAVVSTVAPLVRDPSQSVRDTLLDLLKSIPSDQLQPHTSLIMLHVHSAMTYLQPDIRAQSTNFLNLMLDIAPQEVSRMSFAKTLSCFFPLLGWQTDSKASKLDQSVTLAASTATTGLSYGSKASKTKLLHIESLQKLLTTALSSEDQHSQSSSRILFHPDTKQLLLPQTAGPFLHLELFVNGSSDSNSVTITEDTSDRVALVTELKDTLINGLKQAVKDSGQVGRTASNLLNYVENVVTN